MASDPDDAPSPGLAPAFTLTVVSAAPLVVGTLATGGVREYRGVDGGTFSGRGIAGQVVGGGETLLRRPDGVGVLETSYLIATDAGAVIRAIGTGYVTGEGPFVGTRLSIVFEVDETGPHASLSTRAFVAEFRAEDRALAIAEII